MEKDLSDGITITEGENDTLRLKINDETELRTIELLGEDETKKNIILYISYLRRLMLK